jgi:hypothetical protein
MRKAFFGIFFLPLLCLLRSDAVAQDSIHVPSDSKFVLQIDLNSLRSSKIGSTLLEAAKKAAMEEAGKKIDQEDVSIQKIRDVLGLDPLEEIQGIVLCASNYEKPEKSLLAMIRLKKTLGNIEGLLLAIPGYVKYDYGKYEIHSAAPSDQDRAFLAIHKNSAENHTLILGADKNSVTNLLDSLDTRISANSALKTIDLDSDRKLIASMQVLELPSKDAVGQGPQANIAALLKSFVLSISEEGDELEVRGVLHTSTEKQADKIRQSIQGLSAMVELFASMDEQDADTREMLKFLKQIKVLHEGTSVKVKLRLPSSKIADMLKHEIDNL